MIGNLWWSTLAKCYVNINSSHQFKICKTLVVLYGKYILSDCLFLFDSKELRVPFLSPSEHLQSKRCCQSYTVRVYIIH